MVEPKVRLVGDMVSELPPVPVPVPESEMACGEPVALDVMVMAAVNAPVVVGAKWPWMEQLAPAARLVPQVFANTNEEALAPVSAMLVIDSAAVPVLVMVTDCEPVDTPTVSEPKLRLVADRLTVVGVVPVPVRAMDCGEPVAVSVMVMAAAIAPFAVGAKCPWMLQLAPAARLVPQVLANTN